jgi:hypothetical protein
MITWTKADAWHRRDLPDGSYLMVSRTDPTADRWHWRHVVTSTGKVLAYGPHGTRKSYPSALTAMGCADRAVAPSVAVTAEFKAAA